MPGPCPGRKAQATRPQAQLREPAADLALVFRAAACALSNCAPQVLAADQQQVQGLAADQQQVQGLAADQQQVQGLAADQQQQVPGVSYQQAYQPDVLDDAQKAAALQQQRAYQEYLVFKKFQDFYEAQQELSRMLAADASATSSRPAAVTQAVPYQQPYQQAPQAWTPAAQQPVPATSWPSGYQQLPTHTTGVGAPKYYYPNIDDIPAGSYVPPGGIVINVQTSTPVNVENPISIDSNQKNSQTSAFRRPFGLLQWP